PCHPRDLHSFPTRRSSDLISDRRIQSQVQKMGLLAETQRPWEEEAQGQLIEFLELLLHDLGLQRNEHAFVGDHLLSFLAEHELEDRKSTRLNSSHDQISYA